MSKENLEQYTYDYLMQLALSFVRNDLDKREGSVIYDALAPFCQILAAGAIQLKQFYEQTYALTATGIDLDNRVAEQGIHRYAATHTVKRVDLKDASDNPAIVSIGSRFSTVSDTSPVNYMITGQYEEDGRAVPGAYEATCEEVGTVGNEYSGNLINITFVQGLSSAYMSTTLIPARDEENDEDLRERYFESLNQKAFGGNLADYRSKLREIPGVGAVQIYPTWNGGGTVKLSILDPEYNVCSSEFVATVQTEIDPENVQGESGVGIGLAPIGHKVTVVTPEEVTINVSATLTLLNGYTMGQVDYVIREAISDYISDLRKSWADPVDGLDTYVCDIFLSRVSASIISVPGVANVTGVTLNGNVSDIQLEQNGTIQQIPKLGEVVLNA